jgi:hypothetical protein
MSKRDEQIARMKGLMTYGICNSNTKTAVNESVEGADGKIYAIIREGAKFYIKSTQKGSELVKESFDYIGGYMNKKNNEFTSYNQASKNLELKLRSLNEAYGVNKSVELLNPDKKESLMIEMTDGMKNSIARYRQIINEIQSISSSNTGNPEAPKTSSFNPKIGEPFNQTASSELDKDFTKKSENPEKQGKPYGSNEKTEEYIDAQYAPENSVANQKPKGGKVVRVNENEEYEETIENCDEWGSCGLPDTEGVGCAENGEPFNENTDSIVGFEDDDDINEDDEEKEIELDDIDIDLDDDNVEDLDIDSIDTEDDNQEEDDKTTEDESEIAMLKSEIEELKQEIEKLKNEDEFDDEDEIEYDLEFDDEDDDDNYEDDDDYEDNDDDYENDDDEENIFDSVCPKKLSESGTKLNDFGKHPGYRKKPMSTPITGNDKYGNYKDWNDESVYSEEPFGQKIGDSYPYEYIVSETVDSIVDSLKKKH